MDVSDLLKRVKSKIGLLARRRRDPELTPTAADDEALLAAAKDAIIEVAKQTGRLHGQTQGRVTPLQAVYGISEGLDVMLELRLEDGRALQQEPGAEVRAKVLAENAAQGRPRVYGLHSGALWLYPVPIEEETITAIYRLNGATSAPSGGDGALIDEDTEEITPGFTNSILLE